MIFTTQDCQKAGVWCGDSGLSVPIVAEAYQGGVRQKATSVETTKRNSAKAGIGFWDGCLAVRFIAKTHQGGV